MMKNYNIDYNTFIKYKAIVYSASYINPINDIDNIANDLVEKSISAGYVLFDFLLSNGNNFNRFAEVYFNGKSIEKETICTISFSNKNDISTLNSHYTGRFKELNNSILSSKEKIGFVSQKH